jgi:hypothetical protein
MYDPLQPRRAPTLPKTSTARLTVFTVLWAFALLAYKTGALVLF